MEFGGFMGQMMLYLKNI